MDKRIILIAILAVSAVILTSVRECSGVQRSSSLGSSTSDRKITSDRVYAMADTTLKALGIKKENIRAVRNRNDVRVLMPPAFEPLLFVRAMKDSLDEYRAEIVSSENNKDKSIIVQVKDGDAVLRSFIFTKENVTAAKKGVPPSQPKKQIR
ncbi:MAG: hypothetical protein KA247_07790 [Bacteroidetes bacterium]|nr:hypothetical protein [Bacteroidota bacterium]